MSDRNLVRYTDYDQKLRELAREIVTNIRDAPDILRDHGVSESEYARLAETSQFKAMLRQAATEWGAVENTHQRVRLKSATLVEQALPDMFSELSNAKEPLSSRVALLNSLAKIGNLGTPEPTAQKAGNSFKLSINLTGSKDEPKTITIESNAVLPEPETDPNDELTAGIELDHV
ncbi:MAG: hypothetical protein KGL39_32055 [Patescibacteria group bacterium]|nr:hypothetical protein [Patescibacteria group bacterium]